MAILTIALEAVAELVRLPTALVELLTALVKLVTVFVELEAAKTRRRMIHTEARRHSRLTK